MLYACLIVSYLMIALLCIAYGAKRRSDVIRVRRMCQLLGCYRSLVSGGNAHGKLEDEDGAWYTRPPLVWAHAGGADPVHYGNSLENFDNAIRAGYKCLEIDVALTSDGVPVLSHLFMPNMEHQYAGTPSCEEFLNTKICDRYTPMTLDQFVERYKDFDGNFFVDGLEFVKSRFDYMDYFTNKVPPGFAKKCIVQVIRFDNLKALKGNSVFGGIHFNGIAGISEKKSIRNLLINALVACKVHSVSISDFEINKDIGPIVKDFRGRNIHVSVAGVNTLSHYRRMTAIGVDCIDSDWLKPEDLRDESRA